MLGSSKFGLYSNPYYQVLPGGYVFQVDGYVLNPIVVQPSPNGARILATHYNKKYNVNIQIADHSTTVAHGDNINNRFHQLSTEFNPATLIEQQPMGILLMHGFQHAVPVVFSRENNTTYLIIFDSTSGSRKNGYRAVADLFPNCTILLNNGTRQADTGSCVTDGLCILKDALRLQSLGHFIFNNKRTEETRATFTHSMLKRNLFPASPPNHNAHFYFFNMPEALLKSAQISDFVTQAKPDLDKVISKKNGQTLAECRKKNTTTVSLNRAPEVETDINRYLHKKSYQHAMIIDKQTTHLSPPTSPRMASG